MISVYILHLSLSLWATSFPYLNSLSFFQLTCSNLMLPDIQLISSHPTSCVAVCWRLDDPDPFPQGPPIPQGGAGYHCSIYILNLSYFPFAHLIWSSFQYLILTYILVTYFSIHACLAWNQFFFILSYQLHCCWLGVGWRPPLPRAHPFHRGEGGLMGYDHDHGRGGWGGDPEPGTYIYNIYICI